MAKRVKIIFRGMNEVFYSIQVLEELQLDWSLRKISEFCKDINTL